MTLWVNGTLVADDTPVVRADDHRSAGRNIDSTPREPYAGGGPASGEPNVPIHED